MPTPSENKPMQTTPTGAPDLPHSDHSDLTHEERMKLEGLIPDRAEREPRRTSPEEEAEDAALREHLASQRVGADLEELAQAGEIDLESLTPRQRRRRRKGPPLPKSDDSEDPRLRSDWNPNPEGRPPRLRPVQCRLLAILYWTSPLPSHRLAGMFGISERYVQLIGRGKHRLEDSGLDGPDGSGVVGVKRPSRLQRGRKELFEEHFELAFGRAPTAAELRFKGIVPPAPKPEPRESVAPVGPLSEEEAVAEVEKLVGGAAGTADADTDTDTDTDTDADTRSGDE